MVVVLGHPIYGKTTSRSVELLGSEPFDPKLLTMHERDVPGLFGQIHPEPLCSAQGGTRPGDPGLGDVLHPPGALRPRKLGFLTLPASLFSHPLQSLYTPFSIILIAEVYLLVYYLPTSFARSWASRLKSSP